MKRLFYGAFMVVLLLTGCAANDMPPEPAGDNETPQALTHVSMDLAARRLAKFLNVIDNNYDGRKLICVGVKKTADE